MAAYAALVSLFQTTDLSRYQGTYHCPSNAKEMIRSIHEYVIIVLSLLEDCPEKAKRWEGKIRDIAYKIEDIVEHFIWQQVQSSYREMCLSSVEMKEQLKTVTEEIGLIAGEMMDERPAYVPAAAISSSSSRLAPTAKDAVIGLHDDVMAIKDRLCGLSSKLQVIPIVGMGGIGKTTLAKTVFDDPLIKMHFTIRAWLTVSHDYSSDMLKKVLFSLLDSMKMLGVQMPQREIDESEMAIKVYKNLKGRTYLIVMDDVWSTDVWDAVRNIFPDDDNGSRIMLTTRLSDVAGYPDTDSPLHRMRFMDDHESWNLLRQKVFTDSNCPADLVDIGKQIARSCAGLPLAVVLVAGLLSSVNVTRYRSSWEEIAKTVNHVVGPKLEEILQLSYTHLAHHLRPCFLFVGGFPEDANIHASRLIRLWVAEGFLKPKNGCNKSLEEEAGEYLEDLVKRNLVIVTSRKRNGRIKSCSLHDLVRDMCIRKAREEKFLYVVDGRVVPQGTMTERRVSFSRSSIKNIWGPTIRTILSFRRQRYSSWITFLGQFRLLRVLDAEVNVFNAQIFELIHLRYLALVAPFKIPSTISNLMNLQTLIISRPLTDSQYSLPVEVWRMRQLRHLIFDDPFILPHPPDESNLPLENLLTLWRVKNLVWNEKIGQMIPNVKKLGLVYQNYQDYHLHHLKDLFQLEVLEVYGCQYFSWGQQNPSFPKSLQKMTLKGGYFSCETMATNFGLLPNLQVLRLLKNSFAFGSWNTADGKYPQLKFLEISESGVWEWVAQSSPLPRLECLVLHSCHNLRKIPEGIGEIPTLQLIEIDHASTDCLLKSVKQIKEVQQSYGNYSLQVLVVQKNGNKTSI